MRCVNQLIDKAAKIGVKLSKAEADRIFNDIEANATLRRMGIEVEDAKTNTPIDILRAAAKQAHAEAIYDKELGIRRQKLQLEADTKRAAIYNKEAGEFGAIKAVSRMVERVENRANSIKETVINDMWRELDSYRKALGIKIEHEDMRNVARELHALGEGRKDSATGDKRAFELAKSFFNNAENLRAALNDAGADIGKLKDWIAPQSWDSMKVRFAGLTGVEQHKMIGIIPASTAEKTALKNKARDYWVSKALQQIDPAKYRFEDGTPYDMDTLRKMLEGVHTEIITGGISEFTGYASRARSISQHRNLHFKNADAYYDMMQEFSHADIFQTMLSHIDSSSRNLALLQTFGPNPKAGFTKDINAAMVKEGSSDAAKRATNYFNAMYGVRDIPVTDWQAYFANANRNLRQLLTSSRLGSMLLSQVGDINIFGAIAHTNGFGIDDTLEYIAKVFKPKSAQDRAAALDAGFFIDSFIASAQARYGEAVQGAHWTGRLANATIRVGLGQAWTDKIKESAQMLIARSLFKTSHIEYNALEKGYKQLLARYDITPAEWESIRKISPDVIGGREMITPDAVKALGSDLYLKYMDMMIAEANTMVATPSIKTRSMVVGKSEAGTLWGEAIRNIMLFKMFTASITLKVLPRVWNAYDSVGGRLGMMGAFALMSTICGAVSYQLKEIAKGRNPRPIGEGSFWLAAAAQGGGFGIFGDIAFGNENRYGGGVISSAVGPVAGLIEDAHKMSIGNINRAIAGQKVDFGADMVRFAKSNAPVINLWYTKAALDHMLFYQVQEAVNPGYLRRMKNTVRTRMNQTFWWQPDQALPDSLPEFKVTR